MRILVSIMLLAFAGLACATQTAQAPTEPAVEPVPAMMAPDGDEAIDVYRYYGYNDASESPLGRTHFQDWNTPEGTVGGVWADPDAEYRREGQAWAHARISRRAGAPYLAIDFSREGHGANVKVLPNDGTPMPIPAGSTLVFSMRSNDDVCVGLRVMERDGEIWGYGVAPLGYRRLCPTKTGDWTRFEVPLGSAGSWFKFPYDGNHQLGNGTREMDLMVGIALELGLGASDYLGRGVGRLDVSGFEIRSP